MNIKYKLHLTQNFIQNSRDEYVENLETEKGEMESYIEELEDQWSVVNNNLIETQKEYKQLENEYNELKENYKKLLDKYSIGINEYVHSDEYVQKFKDKIEELKAERDYYKEQRDAFITHLTKIQHVQ